MFFFLFRVKPMFFFVFVSRLLNLTTLRAVNVTGDLTGPKLPPVSNVIFRGEIAGANFVRNTIATIIKKILTVE